MENGIILAAGSDEKGVYYMYGGRKYRLKRTELHHDEGSIFFRVVYIYEPDWQIVDGKREDEKTNKQ